MTARHRPAVADDCARRLRDRPPIPSRTRAGRRPQVLRPAGQPAWARPALLVLLLGTAVLYLWGLGASGLGQLVLLGRRPGRVAELEGVLLRLLRRGQLDHRGQDAGLAVADGPVGTGLRAELLVDPRTRGAGGVAAVGLLYADRAALVRRRPPACSPARCMALTPVAVLMFRFNNPDALLVLLLVAGAYATVRAHRDGQHPVAGRWPARWSASASSPRCCRRCWSCRRSRWPTWSRRRPALGAGSGSCCSPAPRWSPRPAGGSRSSSSSRPRRGPTSAARRPTASSSSPWGTTVSAG